MYLHDTTNCEICYEGRLGLARVLDVYGIVDAYWDGDLDHRRYASSYVFNLFVGVISWMSRRHVVVSLSTTNIESMESTHVSREVVWLQRLCLGIWFVQQVV
jgi:hypothetical protein